MPQKATVSRGFAISLGGVPVPPLPVGKDFGQEVFHRRLKYAMWIDTK
jgi:hypothetical protein